jgi:hypothetical protein
MMHIEILVTSRSHSVIEGVRSRVSRSIAHPLSLVVEEL